MPRLVVGVVGVVAGGRILLRLNCIQSYTVHDVHDVHDRFWVTHVLRGINPVHSDATRKFALCFRWCFCHGDEKMLWAFGPLGASFGHGHALEQKFSNTRTEGMF